MTATNDLATGTPAVLGTAEVRRTLTASTADIADVDGLPGAFTYQWKRYDADGTTFEANIGTTATYTLTATEEGKKVLVEVSFMDVAGTSEGPLVSAAFPESGTVGASFLASNSEQGDDSSDAITFVPVGQAFTIGPDAPSYNVTAVTIFSEDPEGDDLTLQICDVNSNGHPSATCTDLTAPGNFAAGPLTFTPPSGTPLTLFSRTTYMAVLESPGRQQVRLDTTTSDDEDADSLPNWSIRNSSQFKVSTWLDDLGGDSIRITIQGTANPASSTAPTAMDNTVATTEDMPYTFAAADFRFSATTNGDTLASVRIRAQPADGTLTLNGMDVTANQSVTKAQLDAGSLVYTPAAHGFGSGYARFQFRVGGGSEESSFAYWMTIDVTGENDPATGAPTISGTAEVGQTLTASITGIADPEGVPSAFTYQWISVEADGTTNIGANARTYTLTASEEGKKVKVEVSFVDNGGTSEGPLASAAYPASGTVVAAPVPNILPTAAHSTVTTDEDKDHTFAATDFGYADSDGDELASVKITGLPAAGKLTLDGTAIASGALPKTVPAADLTADKLKYRPPPNANGTGYASFTFKVNDGTADSDAEYTMTIDVTSVNDPALSDVSIEGTAQEGQTLTTSVFLRDPYDSEIDDDSYTYQWKRFSADGTIFEADIGTNATYTLTASEVGKTVKFAITFLDGDLNSETILSDAYPDSGTVTAAPEAPTASDGAVTALEGTDYTFAAPDFKYATENANPLVSVKITGAPAEAEDELVLNDIQITAHSVPTTVTTNDLAAGKLTYTPPTDADGTSFKFKVNDGTVDSNVEYTMTITVTRMNAPASGAPTIDGTAHVGQTLTADTNHITDANGLPDSFQYQWKRYSADGTTFEASIGLDSSTYTLTSNEEGKKVQVEVSFVDNSGTSEGPLASAAYPASGTVDRGSCGEHPAHGVGRHGDHERGHRPYLHRHRLQLRR